MFGYRWRCIGVLFLARWQIDSDVRARVLDRFTRTGGTPPPGVRIVGRWHRADGTGGIMIVAFGVSRLRLFRETEDCRTTIPQT